MSWININLKKYCPHRISNGLVLQVRKPRPEMLGSSPKGRWWRKRCGSCFAAEGLANHGLHPLFLLYLH